jgi:hypothetical protein
VRETGTRGAGFLMFRKQHGYDCHCLTAPSRYVPSNRGSAMRFWIGLLIGLVIGVCATAAYYEFWDYGDEEITSQVDDP